MTKTALQEKIGINNRAAAMVFLTAPGMHLVHQDQIGRVPAQNSRTADTPGT